MGRSAKAAALLLTCSSVALAGGFEYKAYDGKHPLADTSLLASVDDRSVDCQQSKIVKVDGKSTGILGPARFSARVLPGTHTFVIRAICVAREPVFVGNYWTVDIDVEVKDMLPLHVYVTRYSTEGGRIAIQIDDLGERAEYRAGILMKPTAF